MWAISSNRFDHSLQLMWNFFENCFCLTRFLRSENHIAVGSKAFSEKKAPCMEMWVKSDYLRVFLCLLRPISRPILFPLSLDKQPISLARSHNWLFPLSQTAVPPCDGIQSAPSAQNSSFTFKLTDRVTMRKLEMRWRLAVFKNYKWPEALKEITEGQWGSVTARL